MMYGFNLFSSVRALPVRYSSNIAVNVSLMAVNIYKPICDGTNVYVRIVLTRDT